MLLRRRILVAFGLWTFAPGVLVGVAAETYPTRPVTIAVPYAAGGGADLIARLLAQKLTSGSASLSWSKNGSARAA